MKTDRTIPNKKPNTIIRKNDKETRLLNRHLKFRRLKCGNERSQRDYNINTDYVKFKNKSDTSNNRGNWNHLKYLSNIPGKHEIKELQKTAILDTAHTYFGKY